MLLITFFSYYYATFSRVRKRSLPFAGFGLSVHNAVMFGTDRDAKKLYYLCDKTSILPLSVCFGWLD